jgi:hypothetical protein
MAQACVTQGGVGQILDTMISLTRLTPQHRVIVAGGESMALYLGLRQRGFIRTTTPALCRYKRTQHAIGFIAGQDTASRDAGADTEGDLERISPFMTVNAELALLVGSGENGLKMRAKLEKLGFRIEAGVRCSQGLVLSASRQGYEQMARAA